ncbi:oxidoreductase [Pasteurellaceae bacterium Macca]|nr:oxidoreductase [Pasteurellaceae bacterium Macca]
MKSINVALIGCGFFGQQLALAFQKSGAILVGVSDLDQALAEQLANKCHCKMYDKFDHLLAMEKPDLVLIATYNNTHFKLAKQALKANCAVFIETPFTLNHIESYKLIQLAEEQGKALFVGHLLRTLPGLQKVKTLLSEQALGKLTVVRANRQRWIDSQKNEDWWKNNIQLTGGKLLHEIHELDLLCWLLGDVESVYAQATNRAHLEYPDNDDIIQVLLRFKNGIFSSLEMGTAYRLHKWDITIHGELGSLLINFFTSTITLTLAIGERQQFNLYDEFEADLSLREHSKGVQKYNQVKATCPFWLSRATEIEAQRVVDDMRAEQKSLLSEQIHNAVCVAVAAKKSILQGTRIQVKYC